MKGGVFAKEEDLDIFLEDCKISYLSKGSFGIALVAESTTSPYLSVRGGIERKINKIIIKVCAINKEPFKITSRVNGHNSTFSTVHEKNFEREIEIHTEVFFRTCEYLDPICPSILHTEVKDSPYDYQTKKRVDTRLSQLLPKSNEIAQIYLKHIIDLLHQGRLSMYGIICMEYAEGYETLAKLKTLRPDKTEKLRDIARHKLIEMSLKTQYTHSDFHENNILCNPDTEEVLLIDFGLANKMLDEQWKTLRDEYKEKRYFDALESIFYIDRRDLFVLRHDLDSYGWLIGADIEENEEPYNETNNNREIVIKEPIVDKIIKGIDDVVKENQEKIEHLKKNKNLPLSKKDRVKFYQFMNEVTLKKSVYDARPLSYRVSRLYDKRVHRRTRSLNRYTLKRRTKSKSKGSREPKIIFPLKNSRNNRNSAVPRGTRR
jgi:serine/threonine protein kinase